MRIPNFAPRLNRSGPTTAALTVPDPSISTCRRGSASTLNMVAGEAQISMESDTNGAFGISDTTWNGNERIESPTIPEDCRAASVYEADVEKDVNA
ncbi:MAG TPA: hypothetical protein VHC49_11995 [Mycobacteriales bacterium]|nr:hypothetical protein [Mycobacteriales bacterium]